MANPNIHQGHRQRMMKRYFENGFSGFEEHEILEMLLFYFLPRVNTNEIAHSLIEHCGSLQKVFKSPVETLKEVSGVGENTASALKFIGDFFEYVILKSSNNEVFFNSTESFVKYSKEKYRTLPHECFSVYYLDSQLRLLFNDDFQSNDSGMAEFYIPRIAKKAVQYNTKNVILSHNHPNGGCRPSVTDFSTTRRLATVFSGLGIGLIDHIIISGDKDYSMRERGDLPEVWR